MMTLEEIRPELRKYSISKVARLAGLQRQSVARLLHEGANPSYETVKKLSDFLSGGDEEE